MEEIPNPQDGNTYPAHLYPAENALFSFLSSSLHATGTVQYKFVMYVAGNNCADFNS